MFATRLGFSLITLIAFAGTAPADDKPVRSNGANPVDPTASALLAAHNREREKEGRPPLKLSEELTKAALAHAKDMAEHHKLDHKGSDESTVVDRVKRQGYAYVWVGENIAYGQKDVTEVMTTWMESPAHHKNILGEFTELGGARLKDDKGVIYWCVDLGGPVPKLEPSEADPAAVQIRSESREERQKPPRNPDSKEKPVQSKSEKPVDPTASALLAAHNREREKESLPPLKLSEKLTQAALVHAKDMAEHHTLDHTGSDKSTVVERVKRQKYPYILVGENIADGQRDVAEVMTTWMESPGHRKNILAEFTEMGGAMVKDEEGVNYWCVDLGVPIPQLKPGEAAVSLLKYLNEERKEREKPLLKADTKLGKAAMAISAAMAEKDSSKLEGDPFKMVKFEPPPGREFRILLSGNAPTHIEAAKSLLGDDPSELDDYREIGVGYAIAKNGTPYWCTILAKSVREKPRAVRIRERQNKAKSDEP